MLFPVFDIIKSRIVKAYKKNPTNREFGQIYDFSRLVVVFEGLSGL